MTLYLSLILAGAITLFGWTWHSGKVDTAVATAEHKLHAAYKTRDDAEVARRNKIEADLRGKVQQHDKLYQEEKARRTRADDVAAAAGQRLRDALANVARKRSEHSAAVGGVDDPRNTIIAQCGAAVERMDKDNRRLVGKVAGLQRYASEVCLKAGS
jgi:hypothetical protein